MVTSVDIDRQREPLGSNRITAAHRSSEIKEERNRFFVRKHGHGSSIVNLRERDSTVFYRDAEGFADSRASDTADSLNRILPYTVNQTFCCRFQFHIGCEHTTEAEDRDFDSGVNCAAAADAMCKCDQFCFKRRKNEIDMIVMF